MLGALGETLQKMTLLIPMERDRMACIRDEEMNDYEKTKEELKKATMNYETTRAQFKKVDRRTMGGLLKPDTCPRDRFERIGQNLSIEQYEPVTMEGEIPALVPPFWQEDLFWPDDKSNHRYYCEQGHPRYFSDWKGRPRCYYGH
jgi:hypothetical protein